MTRTKLLAAALGSALAASAYAQVAPNTLPSGGNVAAGSAAISTPATGTMQIDQATQRAIIDWQSFSIGSAAWVRFNQPGASSVALNRVVGANPSEIFGRLTANGQVFLTNPNGVLFAPGASVEVGSLLATTLSITNTDFLNGNYRFNNTGSAGAVVNQGTIITPNGYTVLAGPQVRNDGVIVARLGTAALAAGDRVSLDVIGDGLINVSVDQAALNASVANAGTIEADGGRVVLTARGVNNLLDGVVNSSGIIRANSLVERNGQILLDASGRVNITGDNPVIASAASIAIAAAGAVTLTGGAAIDTSGGSLQIGGAILTLTVSGNTVISNGSLVVLSESELERRILPIVTRIVVAPAREAQAAIEHAAAGDYRGNRPTGILSERIDFVPPLQHQIQADGIALPPGVLLRPTAPLESR